jgi:hypothetical protein
VPATALGIAKGNPVALKVVVVEGGAAASEVRNIDQSSRLPPSEVSSSEMRSVQVPFGFSPMKAPMASSGTSLVSNVKSV